MRPSQVSAQLHRIATAIVATEGDEYRNTVAEVVKHLQNATRLLDSLVQGSADTSDIKLKGNVEAIYPEVDQLATKLYFVLKQNPD